MKSSSAANRPAPWWRPHRVPAGQHLICQLGTLELVIAHEMGEWTLRESFLDESEADVEARFTMADGADPEHTERFVHDGKDGNLVLAPRLADRPVVIRPRQPLSVLSGQSITLYLSTPLWLLIQVGDPPVRLKELPMLRLSDTWFGPNTREGEICYAGRTQARHNVADLPQRIHRAITPLTIQNKADEPLVMDKISLPVPMLSLYSDDQARLWTQRVTLTRNDRDDLATVRLDTHKIDGSNLKRIAEARAEPGRFGITRAFGLLFGGDGA